MTADIFQYSFRTWQRKWEQKYNLLFIGNCILRNKCRIFSDTELDYNTEELH